MKILIIEDSEQMRCLIKSLVSSVASEVFECHDGAAALTAFLQHQPDCVLMDIKMPQLDGIAATRQILNRDPAARIIMVTDYDDVELRQSACDAGAIGYVLKEDLLALPELLIALDERNNCSPRRK